MEGAGEKLPGQWLLEKGEGRGGMSNRLSGPGLARLCEDGRVFVPVPRCGARGGAIGQDVAAACLWQKGSDVELSIGDLAFPLPSDSWDGKTPCLPSCFGTVLLWADLSSEQRTSFGTSLKIKGTVQSALPLCAESSVSCGQ